MIYETNNSDSQQLNRLKNIVKVEKYSPYKHYIFDYVLRDSVFGSKPDNIISRCKKYDQRLHADYMYLKMFEGVTYEPRKWHKTTGHIACGEFVAKQFEKATGIKPIVIKNILDFKKPVNKIYKFVYAGRLTNEKGWDLVKIFIKKLRESNIKFVLTIFTDTFKECEFEEVHILSPRFDIFDYLADADYGLLLSKGEGLPYFIQECLQYETPVITTDVGGCTELIKDGINGYVVPLNMNFDINKIKNIPVVKDYDNGVTVDTWCDYIDNLLENINEDDSEFKEYTGFVNIRVIQDFKDLQLNKDVKVGDVYPVTIKRANELGAVIGKKGKNIIEIIKGEILN